MKLRSGVVFACVLALVFLAQVVGGERRGRRRTSSATEDFEFEEEIQAHRRRSKAARNKLGFEITTNGRPRKSSKTTEDSELCSALRCSRDEHCLVKNENVALCVPNKKAGKQRTIPNHSSLHIDIDGDNENFGGDGDGDGDDDEDDVGEDSEADDVEEEDNDDDDDDEDDDDDDDDESDDASDYEDESTEHGPGRCSTCPVAKPTFVCGSDNKTYSSPCRIHYHNCVHKASIKLLCNGFCPCPVDAKQWQSDKRWNHFVNKYKTTVERENSPKIVELSSVTTSVLTKSEKEGKHKAHADTARHSKGRIKHKSLTDKIANPSLSGEKQRQKEHNSVLSEKASKTTTTADKTKCSSLELEPMEKRLLAWFAAAMTKQGAKFHLRAADVSPADHCQSEVRWIYSHLDTDRNDVLSVHELADLERDAREPCIQSLVQHCDSNGDARFNPNEWCACFDRKKRPCLNAKTSSKTSVPGNYEPSCDENGYYEKTQCHGSVGLCWCVDKRGVEYANTRQRGKPDCDSILATNAIGDSDDDDNSDDENTMEGSADQPLDI